MSQPTYLINEIFSSIEGETSYQGIPMLFIRFTGCNLRCVYCDTKYAYDEGKRFSLSKLLEIINSNPFEYVHITGGEPLIQKDLILLLGSIKDKKIIIETNGSVNIKPFLLENTILIVDIKTPKSGMEDKNNYVNLDLMRKTDELKFVIVDQSDYEWAKTLIDSRNLIDKGYTINLSPAIPYLEPSLLAEWIVRDGLNVRFNLQIHKFIWGDKRGV
ncbi:7-carboxy-7-deazaguanine synthase [Thermotomaculum hydrothermale]|uniref:7-carboxy-7-deazaguanine synthase n=1 Tax=Thermotomaculum hydrothermale TaxID=981385 RepID=A0A7R6Q116_9BACT|nr:radical SAM protein [Thermotomaculum hydrothermale]BBB33658.1 7-carboxy-7-deazaguanine synthase [Thermotomaculum hydrothermale]